MAASEKADLEELILDAQDLLQHFTKASALLGESDVRMVGHLRDASTILAKLVGTTTDALHKAVEGQLQRKRATAKLPKTEPSDKE